jgi:hypothetical protein
MTAFFSKLKIKNYLYETIEFIFGIVFILFFGFLFGYLSQTLKLNINFRTSVIANVYEFILTHVSLNNSLDTIRFDLILVNQVFVYLFLDIICILVASKSIFDLTFFTKYESIEPKNTQKLKMILYAFIKYVAIVLWIFSWKVNSIFFVVYGILFYLYFPINLIVRIATKSKQSIFFYLLNLKNI